VAQEVFLMGDNKGKIVERGRSGALCCEYKGSKELSGRK